MTCGGQQYALAASKLQQSSSEVEEKVLKVRVCHFVSDWS